MKKLLLAISILTNICFNNFVIAQVPTWLWAKSDVGTDFDRAYSVTSDASGNIIIGGYFRSTTITFGSTTLVNANAGYDDMFIVKYDASGNVLWTKSAGGNDFDGASSVTADASGNIIVVGHFNSPVITFGATTLTNAVSGYFADMFVVKYDASGTELWAKSVGGIYDDEATSITVDAMGNLIVVGHFVSPTISFGSTTLTNAGFFDMFIVKYDANGNVLWAKSAGWFDEDSAYSVTADDSDNIIVTGSFNSPTITFDSTTLTNANPGYADMFIVKYDSSGTVLWSKSAGGSSNATSVTADAFGDLIVAGSFSSPTISFDTITLTVVGSFDIFIVKYNSLGNVLWAKSAGGKNFDGANCVTVDTSGNIFVIGSFSSPTINFDATIFSSAGYYDMFITKYDASGAVLWGKSAGGIYGDYANSVTLDSFGNLIVAGSFDSPTIAFNPTILINSDSSSSDMFFAKIGNTTSIENSKTNQEISVYPNPNTGNFTLQNSDAIPYSIKVFNVFGEKIYEEDKISSPKKSIDISEQPNGIYFLQIQTKQGIRSKKICINR